MNASGDTRQPGMDGSPMCLLDQKIFARELRIEGTLATALAHQACLEGHSVLWASWI